MPHSLLDPHSVFVKVLLGILAAFLVIFGAFGTYVFFDLLPKFAKRMAAQGKTAQAIKLLEFLTRVPSVAGDTGKILVRYLLGNMYFSDRPADAAEQYQRLLVCRVAPGLEGDVRRRLADCLDRLGRETEAQVHREQGAEAVQHKADFVSLSSRGTLLEREHRYSEALACFERAYDASGAQSVVARTQVMVKAGLAGFNAGRPDQAVRWMTGAIDAGATGTHLISACTMAGVAYGGLGDLESGLAYSQRGAGVAEKAGDRKAASRAMSMVASYQNRLGRLEDCLATVQILANEGRLSLTVYIVQAECLQTLGRFDEAEKVLGEAWHSEELANASIPHHAKRQSGVISLATSRLLTERGRFADAWNSLQDAVVAFSGDDKLTLWCDGTASRLYALMWRGEEARSKMSSVEDGMLRFPDDRNTQTGCQWGLALTAQALNDHVDALSRWERYLDLAPDPVTFPRTYYHMGECAAASNDLTLAREYWSRSVDCGIPTYYAGLARDKLTWM